MAKKITLLAMLMITANTYSQNPNFHIYLAFGQSNMEGQGTVEAQDENVDSRFKTLQAIDCPNLGRSRDNWYAAQPPTCNCWSGLSPVDYFGRTMLDSLPEDIHIGVVNVAVGGCDIRLFDKDLYQSYDSTYVESWFLDKVKAYEGNPYKYLIDRAKVAQQTGVIKGILLHQGETNTNDAMWPQYVKKIYDNMMADLSLDPDSVPLLAGEVVHAEQQGCCSSMNNIIANLPSVIPNAHVISSRGCSAQSDNTHFDSEGYRELGRRYASSMLSLLETKTVSIVSQSPVPGGFTLYENSPLKFSQLKGIAFEIPKKAFVSLKIYSQQGVALKELAKREFTPGKHSIGFDGFRLHPGHYYCSMETDEFSANSKLMILPE